MQHYLIFAHNPSQIPGIKSNIDYSMNYEKIEFWSQFTRIEVDFNFDHDTKRKSLHFLNFTFQIESNYNSLNKRWLKNTTFKYFANVNSPTQNKTHNVIFSIYLYYMHRIKANEFVDILLCFCFQSITDKFSHWSE